MIKNHQTTIGILEKGIQEANSTRIQLLGPQALLTEPKFSTLNLADAKTIADNHTENSFLFYIVEKHTENAIVGVEKGIGKIEKEGDKWFINRLVPISQGKTASALTVGVQIADFESSRDTFLTIGTSAPSNINELLFLPHSVVSSNSKGVQTTPVPENSLVGRTEGDIQALDSTELAYLIGRVLLNHIRLAPSEPPSDPQPGMFYYDTELETFRGYDSNGWRNI